MRCYRDQMMQQQWSRPEEVAVLRLQLMGMLVVIGHHAGRGHGETVPKVRRNETPNGASLRNSLIVMDFQPSY